jgi:hypothetical protein
MKKQMVLLLAGLAIVSALASAAGTASAAPITTLFNTGVDGSGTPLPDGTIGDPHYSLISVPGGTTDLRVRTSAGGFPIPPYIGDDSLSAWVGPNNDAQVDGPIGLYDYRTTFDLTGLVPSTASITGGWSSDNDGVQILINGVDSGNPPTSFVQFAIGFAPFTISSGFVSGINTLDFIVDNGGGPTALRVEMTGSAAVVPEPASLTLLGLGAVGIGGCAWRRRRQSPGAAC